MRAPIVAVTRMDTPEQLSMQFAKYTSLAAGVALCGTSWSLKTGGLVYNCLRSNPFYFHNKWIRLLHHNILFCFHWFQLWNPWKQSGSEICHQVQKSIWILQGNFSRIHGFLPYNLKQKQKKWKIYTNPFRFSSFFSWESLQEWILTKFLTLAIMTPSRRHGKIKYDLQYGTLLHSYCTCTYTEVTALLLWSISAVTM